MKSVYIITMWSGGRPAKKWKSFDEPKLLPSGTGVEFISTETRLKVNVVGSISVEEFESGKEEFDLAVSKLDFSNLEQPKPKFDDSNIERLF